MFSRMRRRPIEHGTIPQPIDVDFGWIAQGSLPITTWQRYINGVAQTTGAGVASIQRIASGQYQVFFPLDQVGESLVNAWADYVCSTAGYIASYDVFVGSYVAPGAASSKYGGQTSTSPYLTIYTTTRGTTTLTDVSSLALASIRVNVRWSDADY